MARARAGFEYFGVEIPTADLEVLRRLATDDDRSIGSLIRIIISEWILANGKARLIKTALMAEPKETNPTAVNPDDQK
jgi:hypothetical protein